MVEHAVLSPPENLAVNRIADLSGGDIVACWKHSLSVSESASVAAPSSCHGLSILVAEDNAVNQRLIVRLLEKAGHRVTLAGHGGEAGSSLTTHPFDLVFMDIQMPELDGITANGRIRERELASGTNAHLPIIALTAHAMKGDQERFLAAGMDGYPSKPIRPQELDEILAKYAAEHAHDETEQVPTVPSQLLVEEFRFGPTIPVCRPSFRV